MRKLFALALCGLGLVALGAPAQAQAAPITGEIHFVGLWNPSGGVGDVATATGIDFSSTGAQVILIGTGEFSTLPGFGVAPFADFTFSPVFSGPIVPLWSFTSGPDTYSFDLEAVAVALQTSTQLALTGSGTLHKTGFDDTPADWDFTGNSGGVIFSFSADNNVVPEPATLGLLGLGLVGLTAAGKKRARRIA